MDQSSTPHYEFRGFRLDTTVQTLVSPSAEPVQLPSRAYEVLRYLVERPGELIDRGSLMKAAWPRAVVEDNNLNQCILALRKALGEAAGERRFILTVPGRGFKFVAPVRVIPNAGELPPVTAQAPPDPEAAAVAARQSGSAATAPATAGTRRRWLRGMVAVAIGAILAVAAVKQFSPPSPVTLPSEYEQLTDVTDSATAPALSPDGRMLAFIRGGEPFLSAGQIWLKLLPDGEPVQLTSEREAIFAPVFTPDGTRVAYSVAAQTSTGGSWDTRTVPVTGGAPRLFLPNASGLSFIGPREVMYSEFKTGIHLGIATSLDDRSRHRDIYLPSHMRAMAHYSYLSPDRRSVLVVEMNGANQFARCRLVPFDSHSSGHPVGPDGSCGSAAWSADGKWMYFAASRRGHSHLWRQRYPDGAPEQITFGPNDEEAVAPGRDGHSLLTSIGLVQISLWMHTGNGEHKLTTESYALLPHLTADGRRVYFLTAQSSSDPPQLWRLDIASGRKEPLVTGFDISDYAISHDERVVVFTARHDGRPEIWQASLDRTTAPKLLLRGGDEVAFDQADKLYFRSIGDHANYLYRMAADGRTNERVLDSPITNLFGVSPDGRWIAVGLPLQDDLMASSLVPSGTGKPQLLGKGWWAARWSQDGRSLLIENGMSASEQTLVVPTTAEGLPSMPVSAAIATGISIPHSGDSLSVGAEPSSYVFVQRERQRNIYRIPLH